MSSLFVTRLIVSAILCCWAVITTTTTSSCWAFVIDTTITTSSRTIRKNSITLLPTGLNYYQGRFVDTARSRSQLVVLASSSTTSSTTTAASSTSTSPSTQQQDDFAHHAMTTAGAVSSLRGQTIVVKYGGNAMTSEDLKTKFCQDVATLQNLGIRIVVVHGGGPQISNMLEKMNVESRFEGGMRVSSMEVVNVAEMVLCGTVNKEIASKICTAGGRALGLSGRDDQILQCVKEINKDGYDLGYVGKVEVVNTATLEQLLDCGICPVISPIGCGIGTDNHIAYNVNADVAAGRIAGELKASRVLFLTDIAGVLNKNKQLIPTLSIQQVKELIQDETITGGMIPKVTFATSAIELGVKGAFITDGRIPHALLREVLAGGAEGRGSGSGGTIVSLH